ncbi:Ig-like domain-containing protein [Anaerorhabdus sp.]|uniref:Ig-like domain-containing protein n=2 Tax=Anaerorhabdus sp. TaxID=1872524 RepID=UPI002FCB7DF0
MHRVYKRIYFILFCTLFLFLGGCTSKQENITVQEWLETIIIEMNIPEAINQQPYFLNINQDHPYFNVVQASTEWGVIEQSVPLNLEANLTKEWVAYTLMNLMEPQKSNVKIKDSSKSMFPEQIADAVGLGIFSLDKRDCFNPKDSIYKEEALQKLSLVKEYVDYYVVDEPVLDFEINETVSEVDVPIEFNEDNNKAVFHKNQLIDENDIVHWKADQDYFYRIKEAIETENGIETKLEEVEYEDVIEQFEMEDSFDVDFSDAEIEINLDEISVVKTNQVQNMISKEIKIKDFEGTIEASTTGISLKLKKGDLKVETKIYNVKPTVRWKTSSSGIDDAFFKLDFKTTELIKLEPSKTYNMYSNFASVKGEDFIQTLLSSFRKSEDMEGTEIPICQIKVPFPNFPLLDLTMQLKLHLYAGGKVELVLANEHQIGIEIKNNKMRTVQESKRDADFIIKASTSSTLGLTTGVRAGNIALMDIGIKGGIRGYVDTILHLYDKNGEINSKNIQVDLDKADMAALYNEDVKVCGNINLHWVLDLIINTQKTVASKIGLSKTINILDEKNGKLILNKKTHIENWQFMEHCTRGKRKPVSTKDTIESDRIGIEKMNIVVDLKETKQIIITSLPKGYKKSDIQFNSNEENIAKVTNDGVITPIKRGSAIITIKTSDGKFKIDCNVLVTDKNTNDLRYS